MNGFLLVYKEPGCTSHDVVAKVRNLTKAKTGHLGTLDPFASGLLPIALGKATRFSDYFLNKDKGYIFTIKWGEETDTLDNTGTITNNSGKIPSEQEILDNIPTFLGESEQVPPQFSALKIKGKKAYEYAREGVEVELKKRPITIYQLELLRHGKNYSKLKLRCSKGTYVRALARDIAYKLGTVGHLTYLERDYISGFDATKSPLNSEFLFKEAVKEDLEQKILNLDSLIKYSYNLHLGVNHYKALKNGAKILINNLPFKEEKIIKVKLGRDFVAIATYQAGLLKPKMILINN